MTKLMKEINLLYIDLFCGLNHFRSVLEELEVMLKERMAKQKKED